MKQSKIILIALFVLFFTTISFTQKITGDRREIKELVMSSNEITTILYNYGSICKPNMLENIADMMWKDLGYMYEFGPLIAAEVIGESGETLHITSDSFVLTGQGDYNPDGTQKWGWLPRAGYSNPNSWEIANSLNSESWPSEWSYWPGEYGEDIIIAENEIYYVMDDFSNAEFNYYPFPDDTSKRGLGVSSEVRMYQFSGFLKDALIIKYKITNESLKDLSKVYFGFHNDPHIGGASDYSDDMAGYLPNNYEVKAAASTIYAFDDDGIGGAGKPTGYFGFKLLNTPNDLGLTSLHVVPYTNSDPNVPRNDALMWEWLSAGSIDENQPLLNSSDDHILNFGTGPFELKAGESTQIEIAIFMSDDFDDMLHDAYSIQHYINWPSLINDYNYSDGNENYKIELNELQEENDGSIDISWNYTGTNPNAKVFIDYSSDGGIEWTPLVKNHNINENYIWDSKFVEDGVNYILRVLAYNPENTTEYYYDNSNERFTINNPEKNSFPEFQIVQLADTLSRERANIKWISEDADNSELKIIVEHSIKPEGSFQKIYEANHSNGLNSFSWDLTSIPNYETNYLRFTIKDDANETVFISNNFTVNISRGFYASSQIEHITGNSTAEIEIIVADTNLITNSRYEITFTIDDETRTYSVKNINTNEVVLENIELLYGMSSPTFEGLRLNIVDTEMDINYNITHFNREELESIYDIYFSESNADYIGSPHVKSSLDWIIVFNDLDTNSDGSWVNIGETTLFVPSMIEGICPFTIIDIDNNEKASYLIDETRNPNFANDSWDSEEPIILRPQNATNALVSYSLKLDFTSGIIPRNGDTLFIITDNPLHSTDVFQFQADEHYILSNKGNISAPNKFYLSQNYPNPFNPSTVISYSLPKASDVQLLIYNMLGQEVATLVNQKQNVGRYDVEFNASNLPSGIYFYSIRAEEFFLVKKMLLLK